MNLKTISDLSKRFNCIVGISDHSMGILASIVAIPLGAKIVEKHFILDRKIGGPDASFSMEPDEFKKMVDSIRNVEKILGKVTYNLTPKMKKSRNFSRSLFVAKDIKKGEIFNEINIRSIRPGFGLHPKHLQEILGNQVTQNLKKGTALRWKFIKNKNN